ncbi:helix-turn-helix domain-containing protein [Embleya sp. NPDC005971]|uniref:PucR family transcriptional regulator n=1 Tax=Embleya sp. NPDC005971 TaxID=3156724 RepID=UPI0033F0308C
MGNLGDAGGTATGGEPPLRPGDKSGGGSGSARAVVAGAAPRRLPLRRRKAVGGGASAPEPTSVPQARVAGASTAWDAGENPHPASGSAGGSTGALAPAAPAPAKVPRPAGRPIVETAVGLAGRLAQAASDAKYRSDLMRDLLTGRGTDLTGWTALPGGPLLVVVAEADPAAAGGDARAVRAGQEALALAWSTALAARAPEAAVAAYPREVVALLGAPDDGQSARLVAELAAVVHAECAGVIRSFTTGISRPAHSLDALPTAYEQARRAVAAGRRIHGPGAVADFDRLGVFRLLSLIPDPSELDRFAREALRSLAHPRDPEAADLRNTLQALLDTNLNVAETARRLYVHYNTLRYRITKLERLLGPFTQDPHLRLNLMIALQIVRMQGG